MYKRRFALTLFVCSLVNSSEYIEKTHKTFGKTVEWKFNWITTCVYVLLPRNADKRYLHFYVINPTNADVFRFSFFFLSPHIASFALISYSHPVESYSFMKYFSTDSAHIKVINSRSNTIYHSEVEIKADVSKY